MNLASSAYGKIDFNKKSQSLGLRGIMHGIKFR
jgi:hypothetical protein